MGDIAVYARISVDNGIKKDVSIENQILAANQYIKSQADLTNKKIRIYKDNGKTGQNFDRPGWSRLIYDAEHGKIDILVVKDFSRIGRNYIEAGELLEKKFPLLGVRLISISDGYDSGICEIDLFCVGMKNIINDWYAKEGGRKVSWAKQQRKKDGEFVGGNAPYGYKTCLKDGKRVLVLDESMEIVKLLHSKRKDGMTSKMVVDWLADNRINKPSVYRKTGRLYAGAQEDYEKWDSSGVRRIWK